MNKTGFTSGFTPEKSNISPALALKIKELFKDCGVHIFPGFCDVHVHLREPGFSYKETILTGSLAAAKGGFTAVCPMPNLSPVPDSAENLKVQLDLIKRDAVIRVIPYAALTAGENGKIPADLSGTAADAAAFSDDGKGVQDERLMEELMKRAKELKKIVAAHCEDESLVKGGCIHQGRYAREHSHAGISSESEWRPIERDLEIAAKTGCAYHVCHVSAKESVELIRQAKKSGVDVTCETAPHYLLLCDDDLIEDGRFKMNPPVRSADDRDALIEGIKDGAIDMVATDHAPHSEEEKSRGLKGSLFGVTGLEIAFSALYTGLVKKGVISLEKLVDLMCYAPRKRFNIPLCENEFSVWDLDYSYVLNKESLISLGKATPFENTKLYGKNLLTVYNNKAVYTDKSINIPDVFNGGKQ